MGRGTTVLELDLASDIWSGVGLNELIADLENGDGRVNVENLTTTEVVDSLEEGLEIRITEIFSLNVGLNPDADGPKDIDGVLSLTNGVLCPGKGYLGVEVEFPGKSTAVGSCLFIQETSKSDGSKLVSNKNVRARYRERDDRALDSLPSHERQRVSHSPVRNRASANFGVECLVPGRGDMRCVYSQLRHSK